MNECYGYDNQDGLQCKKIDEKTTACTIFETLLSSNSGQGILRNSAKRIMSQTKSEMWNYNGKTIPGMKKTPNECRLFVSTLNVIELSLICDALRDLVPFV